MTTLVIGSTAARSWFPNWRDPKDFDAFTNEDPQVITAFTGELPGDLFWDDRLYNVMGRGEQRLATPDELYTIKHSHAYWELRNGSWQKHMADLLTLQKGGAKLLPDWHDTLYAIWEDRHGKKRVDLTMEADEFFADAVTRIYDHDSIHRSVAYTPGKPIYDDCLKDGKTVQMDMGKVWALPHDQQVRLFREEIYVTALERIIIPRNYQHSPGAAYQWALRRTITSLTKGESAKFIVSNFGEFVKPDMDYVRHHQLHKSYLEEL
ncbi:DUF7275 domain-containing protein [Mycolicibacterium palauense]|uniref:DUF7275 domain-containing protein n=1 Tax=Mycolicibacterium palauense TaxID=2034511 RepID=UPI000BFF01B3|nr:hypothetical protein [Mycolicibacterium palauense]